MPHADSSNSDGTEPKKLILCFDGTGNTFSGSNADTNVVKILRKLDRNHPNQFHYYQTGIGTYDINEKSVNKGILGEFGSKISQTLDSGFATTFDAHVIAGYRFLMRYYEPNAKIYVFGFSRGAYTAKFLARMVNKVGLLCKGNEEMVPFAYRLYQRYLQGEIKDSEHAQCSGKHNHAEGEAENGCDTTQLVGTKPEDVSQETQDAQNEIEAFSQTFCRKETNSVGEEENIKVFFLGIWDCVASVAVLERKAKMPVPVTGTARHVRHAVAVDERRVKFKPALLAQDIRAAVHSHDDEEDIKEVWFPGNHGDVGGGWPAQPDEQEDEAEKLSFWGRIKNAWVTRKAGKASQNLNNDRLQMSDIPLEWMIREVKKVGQMDSQASVHWCHSLGPFERDMQNAAKRREATHGFMHDTLSFGYGTGFFKVLLWKFMEWLPFLTRWELDDRKEANIKLLGWKPVTFPPNMGSFRDIPRGAVLHQSLLDRLQAFSNYTPGNNHGDSSDDCFKGRNKALVYNEKEVEGWSESAKEQRLKESHFKIHSENKKTIWEDDKKHQTYDFNPDFKFAMRPEIVQ
ncbi:short chain dehydrogenase reductase family [Fusarium austroafricanum]|uniref:Short chain dehydrogenase reductase family n=1 Tax=Fusarium austroafricanum TaxID=2364996 RepID=A0A8H4NZS2_9HYPO|nr:short chain dehydrogenase reductase family [Fusarium austroafricanum]